MDLQHNRKIFFALVVAIQVICIFFIYAILISSEINVSGIHAKYGVLNLKKWDFKKDGIVSLKGQWEIYWNRLLTPKDFEKESEPRMTDYYSVPGVWENYKNKREGLSGKGYMTYRLHINNPRGNHINGILIKGILSSYKMWVNGSMISHNGVVGKTYNSENPSNHEKTAFFMPKGQNTEIIIQVSNHVYGKGGIWSDILLGTSNQIENMVKRETSFDMFVIGCLFLTGFFYLFLYITRSEERSYLYFSLLSLLIAFRAFSYSNMFPVVFPHFPYLLQVKEEAFIYFAGIAIFMLYIKCLYPSEMSSKILNVYLLLCGIFICALIVLPLNICDEILPTFKYGIAAFIYVIYVLIKAVVHRRDGASIIITGFILFGVTFFNDMLKALGEINTPYLNSIGFFIFIIYSQAFVLFSRFINTLINAEKINQKLLYTDKLKDEFLANTSHELRTPLNGIIGITESLIDGAGGKLNDITVSNLRMISSSAKRLSSLVNDILDFSRLKNQDMVLQRKSVDLKPVVESIFTMLRYLRSEKDVRYINSIDEKLPPLYADENRLQQIMYNLLSNAIKFTEKGEVRVYAVDRNGMIEVSVEDTGIGIDKNKQEEIFDSFVQLDSTWSKNYYGTGLGLTIAKKLIEMHDGEIEVSSKPGKGTVFTFTIPALYSPLSNAADDTLSSSIISEKRNNNLAMEKVYEYNSLDDAQKEFSKGDCRLLVIDDEIVNLQVLINFLYLDGYSVITASNGIEAMDILRKDTNFQLVIVDAMMPKMSGLDFIKQVRRKLSMYELPIIMLTAKNQPIDISTAFQLGANDYISKPFNKTELLARVSTHIRLKNAVKEAIESARMAEETKMNARETEKQLKESVETEKFKNTFFTNISHELKTPLNLIFSSLQLIEIYVKNEDDVSKDKTNRYLHIIRQNSFRMLKLVTNLIDITRMDSGYYQLNMKNHDIVSLIEDVTLSVAEYMENKSIKFVFDTEIEEKIILCDPDAIERIILNLLSNAVKFTKEAGIISVNIFDKGETIVISVKDNGCGIPKEKAEIIFERFRQVDNLLTRSQEGSGIGLSLVKTLVEMHGGKIMVESEIDVGSEFIVQLPAKATKTYEEDEMIKLEDNIQKINIEFSDIYN